MKIFKAWEYGVKPNEYCEKELEKFLESIPKNDEEKIIEFQKGDYLIDAENLKKQMLYITNTVADKEFSKDETPHLNRAPLCFENLKNVTVQGNGARFIIHGKATNTVIAECENITVKDLVITADNPEMHELTVVGKGTFFVDYEIDKQSEYTEENGEFFFVGHGYKRSFTDRAKTSWWNGFFPAQYPEMCQRKSHPFAKTFKIKEIGEHKIRAYGLPDFKLKKGDKYCVFDVRRQYAGIFVRDSKNVTLQNVKQHFNYSLAFVAQNTENITVDSVCFAPDENSGRVMCSVADFLQICMCRGKVLIKNSLFSGAGDDCLNVHGFHFKIVEHKNNTLKVRFMHPQSHGFNPFKKGDGITFVNPKTMLEKGRATVESSTLLDEYEILLELDNTDCASLGEFVENVTACPDVEFTDNEITRIITRGLLLTTRGETLIQNNHFKSTTMSGILLSDDANNWYESGACCNMTIKNNTFDWCGENGILIKPENTVHRGAVHKNITVTDNTFNKCERTCFDIKSADNVVIKNNKVGKIPKILETQNVTNLIKDF